MAEPVRVVVTLEGGLVQDVSTMGVAADVLVVDLDTDGVDAEDLTQVGPVPGPTNLAVVSLWRVPRGARALDGWTVARGRHRGPLVDRIAALFDHFAFRVRAR